MGDIAIFHDNFAQMGGAERVAAALTAALPGARLHTTLAATAKLIPALRDREIRTTWMQHLPEPGRYYRHYFLLYPFAIEGADLRAYDLVVSSCFGYAKGVRTRPDALHVCYCHTPTRWIWRRDDYLARERFSRLEKRALSMVLAPLRRWDLHAATRPDFFVTNSQVVAERIRTCYGRNATVIPPPIDVDRFRISRETGDFYLIVARMSAYKRIDLAVQACNLLRRKLIVIGDGPDRARLQQMAGPTVTFMGRQPDDVVTEAASTCRALLFPGEEDFGMAPLEVNASGRPVVAWRGGGAAETVREDETGVFFDAPTPESLAHAIERLERREWAPDRLRSHAAAYDRPVFVRRIRDFLHTVAPSGHVRRLLAAHG
ncbi:MAG: glycosyltransferase [Luteitalea sp.]|nr:glycosyltransferase [Luteitalea sp.]